MPPRPILKGLLPPSSDISSEAASNPLPFSSCSTILDSPHVHFPPTPTLTSTEITHSPFIYDRAPIVVSPNTCALPERGGRYIGGNNNIGGLGYFHPHSKFLVDAGRVERDSSETVSPAIFSASVTVGNVNDCGSVGLFMKKRSGPLYDHDYDYDFDQCSSHDQHTQHAQHVFSPLNFDCSSKSSDLGVFSSPASPYIPPPPSSLSSSASPSPIPHSSVNQFISHTHIEVLDASGYPTTSKQLDNLDAAIPPFLPPSSSISTSESAMKPHQDKKTVDVDGKRRRKTHRTGGVKSRWTMIRLKDSAIYDTSREFELEGCLGGF